ncbi:MAG: hypothetical protein JWP17_2806 [Solirubrobacterales bacterium]|nr:hypothetical protein [Solirubrobacterales bacterium]
MILRRRLTRRGPPSPSGADAVLSAFAQANAARPVTFVQIGSNDGVTGDPLRSLADHHEWSGVLVEPVPYVFERLRRARGDNPRLALENAAIADHDGTAPFFHLDEQAFDEALPNWYDQLGSFSLPTLLSHEDEIPGLRKRLRTREVSCMTFDSLCAKHGLGRVDLVHVDAEGYDWEVLRRLDLDRYRPAVVLYEHCHLSCDDRAAAHAFLETRGLRWHEDERDTICVRETELEACPPLRHTWERLGAVA